MGDTPTYGNVNGCLDEIRWFFWFDQKTGFDNGNQYIDANLQVRIKKSRDKILGWARKWANQLMAMGQWGIVLCMTLGYPNFGQSHIMAMCQNLKPGWPQISLRSSLETTENKKTGSLKIGTNLPSKETCKHTWKKTGKQKNISIWKK